MTSKRIFDVSDMANITNDSKGDNVTFRKACSGFVSVDSSTFDTFTLGI